MPAHVRAADAPEDLWRCHECGWTYPNHHPSAKHRRNHKRQCGKISGFTRSEDLTSDGQGDGSSDDSSSDEERLRSSVQALQKNGYHQEQPQSPTQAGSSTVEQGCDNRSDLLSRNDGEAHITPNIHEETAVSTRNSSLPDSKNLGGTRNGNDPGRSNFRSAHAFKGHWTCRHCGWAYPNAHPSAKNRRKHKKTCGVGAQHAGAGGSSDEASSDDGIESTEYAGKPEPLKGDSSASRLSPGPENEVSAKDTDLFTDVQVGAAAEIAQVSSEPDSGNALVLRGTTHLDGVFGGEEEEKLESCESQGAIVDEGNIEPTDEQESVPVQLIETINSKQSQMFGGLMNRAVSNGVKPSDLNGTVARQQPLNATSEQLGYKKPHHQVPSQRVCARDDGEQSINGLKEGYLEGSQCQSNVINGTRSLIANVDHPELATKTSPKSPLRAIDREESLNAEERSSPGSPEGLVRSRVQIFEKLAGSSPQYRRKSISPKTNYGSPQLSISSPLQNGTAYTKITGSDSRETPKNANETVSDRRHHQCSERTEQSVAKLDATSELQVVM